jgi:MFS family permease
MALGIGAALTLVGSMAALFFLPETSHLAHGALKNPEMPAMRQNADTSPKGELASAMALTGVNRLTLSGILAPTFALWLLENAGASVAIGGNVIGVATLAGAGLGLSYLVSMMAAPVMGRMSDSGKNRWAVAVRGLVPGVVGFSLMALGYPWAILAGLVMIAAAGGSNQGLSTAIVGDLSHGGQSGQRMGILFTVGDLTSAIGPPVAYALIPIVGLKSIYLTSSLILAVMLLIARQWAATGRRNRVAEG